MSDLTQLALVSYLESQAALTALLARDPNMTKSDNQRPAIFGAWRNRTPAAHPQLIVKEIVVNPDGLTGLSGGIFKETWHIQVWDRSRNGLRMQKINRLVRMALHEVRIPMDGIWFKYMHQVGGGIVEGFDPDRKENFSVQPYVLCYGLQEPEEV